MEVKHGTHCQPVPEPSSLIYGPEFFYDPEEQHKTVGRKVVVTDQRRVPGDWACRKGQRGTDFNDTAVAAKKLEGTDQPETSPEYFSMTVQCQQKSDVAQNLNMSKNCEKKEEEEAFTNKVTYKPSKLKTGHTIQFFLFVCFFIFSGAKT